MSAHIKIESLESRQLMTYSTGASSVQIGDTVYFSSYGNTPYDTELWKSNPDGSGATLVKNINPNGSSNPRWLTEFQGLLYFVADNGADHALYRSDGTAAGTVRVKDIYTGTTDTSTNPSWLTVYNNALYFIGDDGAAYTYHHLYKYNGVQRPTPLQSTQPGVSIDFESDVKIVNGLLYFWAKNGDSGYELGRTDGTNAGTLFLGDLNPGPSDSYPTNLTALNNDVIFEAETAQGKNQLFTTDGTPDGTVQLYPTSGSLPGSIDDLHVVGGLAYFQTYTAGSGHIDHWQTDGTVAGTSLDPNYRIWEVDGTSGNDDVTVDSQNGVTTITINGIAQSQSDADFSILEVHLGDGNDLFTATAGYSKSLAVYGEAGNDTLSGGVGNDVLNGGAGKDTADYSSRTTAIQIPYQVNDPTGMDVIGAAGESDTLQGFETLLSGSGDDSIHIYNDGTTPNQFLYVDGGAGNDTISLGALKAVPTVHGGEGNDTITAEETVGLILTDPSTDYNHPYGSAYAYGDGGDDTFVNCYGSVYGGDGVDTVECQEGYYLWQYNAAPDRHRWYQMDTVYSVSVSLDDVGGDGPYHLDNIHSDVELVVGTQGKILAQQSSTLPSSPPPASPPPASPPPASPPLPPAVTASPAIPFATVSNHLLSVTGTTGNDRITIRHKVGDASVLQVVRNGKISNFTFSDVKKIRVTASNGNDFVDLRDIAIGATLLGGNGNDSVYGSAGADSIDGGRGDDYLCGMAGNDSITGGIGHDFIRGGDGVDRLFALAGVDDLKSNKGDTIIKDVVG